MEQYKFLPEYPELSEWLAWELDEFAFPTLTGWARSLWIENGQETENYLRALETVPPEVREVFYVPIYETLCIFAERNDTAAILWLLSLCKGIHPQGYYDGVTALGMAVEKNAHEAMAVLIANGADPDWCVCGLPEDSLEFALSRGASDETIRLLVKHGASVSFEEILSLVTWYDKAYLAKEVLLTIKPEKVQGGKGIPGLMEFACEYRSQAEESGEEEEQEAYEILMRFLRELQAGQGKA